jgi:hypothetical protein
MVLELEPYVSSSDTEGGIVLLDELTGRYWQLNGSGAFVLQAMLDGATESTATELLISRYQVTEDQAAEDVATLIKSLREARVVKQ